MQKLPVFTRNEITANRTQFIAELRSTKKAQGSGKLKSTLHEYCCLGVCAKMINPKVKIKTMLTHGDDESENWNIYRMVDNFLGLNDGIISRDMFMEWNDELKLPFKKIADEAEDIWGLKS